MAPALALRCALAAWDQLPTQEQAGLTATWDFWARSKQRSPEGRWRTWGFLTGRGFGKTLSISEYINAEVNAERVRLICLLAQDEQSSIDIQVTGPSGLIATAPPWRRPRFEPSRNVLIWPNGATAYIRTPEVPGKIRGLEYDLIWASELQSWPKSTMQEAWDNVFISARVGSCKIIWDSTAKRRHPLLKELLAQHEANPSLHHIIRGTTHENASNLGEGYIEDLERKFRGTLRGREELLGEVVEDAEGALFKQAWIDANRRPAPAKYARKVVGIDPAVSDRKGSDTTGLILDAVGVDAHGYVLADRSGKYKPEAWGTIVLDWVETEHVDVVVAETNKGGALVAQNLKLLGAARGLEVVVVERNAQPHWMPGKVFVKEAYARGAKEDRAEPLATAYERGRISHVLGKDLTSLEDTLTTWEPAPNADSPGDLDAHVHAMADLLELNRNEPDAKRGFEGLQTMQRQIQTAAKPASLNSALRFGSGRGDRI